MIAPLVPAPSHVQHSATDAPLPRSAATSTVFANASPDQDDQVGEPTAEGTILICATVEARSALNKFGTLGDAEVPGGVVPSIKSCAPPSLSLCTRVITPQLRSVVASSAKSSSDERSQTTLNRSRNQLERWRGSPHLAPSAEVNSLSSAASSAPPLTDSCCPCPCIPFSPRKLLAAGPAWMSNQEKRGLPLSHRVPSPAPFSSFPFKSGDWLCLQPSCHFHNFARQQSCVSCGAPRPRSLNSTSPQHGGTAVLTGPRPFTLSSCASPYGGSQESRTPAIMKGEGGSIRISRSTVPSFFPAEEVADRQQHQQQPEQPQQRQATFNGAYTTYGSTGNGAYKSYLSGGSNTNSPTGSTHTSPFDTSLSAMGYKTYNSLPSSSIGSTSASQSPYSYVPAGLNADNPFSAALGLSALSYSSFSKHNTNGLGVAGSASGINTPSLVSSDGSMPYLKAPPLLPNIGLTNVADARTNSGSPDAAVNTAAKLASLGVNVSLPSEVLVGRRALLTCQTSSLQMGAGINPTVKNADVADANKENPPIVNTGNSGPMCVQPGDWICIDCGFIVSSIPLALFRPRGIAAHAVFRAPELAPPQSLHALLPFRRGQRGGSFSGRGCAPGRSNRSRRRT